MTTLHDRLARAMCCPSGVCCSPCACYAEDRSRSHLVDIHAAIPAMVAAISENPPPELVEKIALMIRERWRKEVGPFAIVRDYHAVAPQPHQDGDHPV